MKNFLFTLIITIIIVPTGISQNKEKIKGDRNVTIKQTYIDDFNKIVVGEKFSIEIVYNKKPSVEIETDENLHDVINFEVIDGVLVFKTLKRIASSKKMNIRVNYGDALQHIETQDDGVISSLTSIETAQTTLETKGTSKAYLNIKTDTFSFVGSEKSKAKLNITANISTIELNDSSKLEIFATTSQLDFHLYERSTATLSGTATDLMLTQLENKTT